MIILGCVDQSMRGALVEQLKSFWMKVAPAELCDF